MSPGTIHFCCFDPALSPTEGNTKLWGGEEEEDTAEWTGEVGRDSLRARILTEGEEEEGVEVEEDDDDDDVEEDGDEAEVGRGADVCLRSFTLEAAGGDEEEGEADGGDDIHFVSSLVSIRSISSRAASI